jgi:hypothetical protein
MLDSIFILTAPRSGSTLLRVMLAGHPALFCPPELNLLAFDTMREREAALGPCCAGVCSKRGCDQRHGLQRALMELRQIDDNVSRQMIDAMIDRNDLISRVYEMLAILAVPRRLVDKSPSYSTRLEILLKAEVLFRGARYIHLHRHPYAVIESLLRNGFEASIEEAEAVWTTANNNVAKFLSGVERDRQIRIPYELLVSEPERIGRELCAFLNIEYDAAVIAPYDGTRMTDGIRPGVAGSGDPNFRRHDRIEPSLGIIWRELDLAQAVGPDTRRVGAELTYECT